MSERLDVVGIGNAMVDAIIPSSREEIEKHRINRDSMNLINEELKIQLHQDYPIKEMIGGGSLGNSMFGITSFGGKIFIWEINFSFSSLSSLIIKMAVKSFLSCIFVLDCKANRF